VQQAADCRENEEAREGVARLANWRQTREVALQRRQLTEFEALLNRGALRRDELELHKLREDQSQEARWRAATAELGHIHRSELVNLELLFETMAQAGKQPPLRESTYRRLPTLVTL